MKKIKKFKIKAHTKQSGTLIPLSFNNRFPIKVKRIFFIHGSKNKIRGKHAHKKCSQYFIPIHGKILLRIKTLDYKKNILLNHKIRTSVLVPPKYWCEIKFLSKNSIIMVACDMYYDPKDYLSNFKKYKEHLNNL